MNHELHHVSRIGSPSNMQLYEKVATHLHWTPKEFEELVNYAVTLSLLNGFDAVGQEPEDVYPYLSRRKEGTPFSLFGHHHINGEPRGDLIISPEKITLYYGDSIYPSAILPFRAVHNKQQAETELFPYNNPSNIKFLSLVADGGLMYVQVAYDSEPNRKHTFVDCTRWFSPHLGGRRQIWMRSEAGIPGSRKGSETRYSDINLKTVFNGI